MPDPLEGLRQTLSTRPSGVVVLTGVTIN